MESPDYLDINDYSLLGRSNKNIDLEDVISLQSAKIRVDFTVAVHKIELSNASNSKFTNEM